MKTANTMKIVILIVIAVLVCCGFIACRSAVGEKYSVTYDNKALYRGAKDSYTPGKRVTVTFPSDEDDDPKQEDVFFE